MDWKKINEKKAMERASAGIECEALKEYNDRMKKAEQDRLKAMAEAVIPIIGQFKRVKKLFVEFPRYCAKCNTQLVIREDDNFHCPKCDDGWYVAHGAEIVYPKCPVCHHVLKVDGLAERDKFNGFHCSRCGYEIVSTPVGPRLILPSSSF